MTAIYTSKKSYAEYRAAFAIKGDSINRWAKTNGYSPQYIYDILRGSRTGPAASSIITKVDQYLAA